LKKIKTAFFLYFNLAKGGQPWMR